RERELGTSRAGERHLEGDGAAVLVGARWDGGRAAAAPGIRSDRGQGGGRGAATAPRCVRWTACRARDRPWRDTGANRVDGRRPSCFTRATFDRCTAPRRVS